jgi:hypothetical protein
VCFSDLSGKCRPVTTGFFFLVEFPFFDMVGDDLERLGDDFLLHHDWKVDSSFIKKLAAEEFSVLWSLCDKVWTLIRFL